MTLVSLIHFDSVWYALLPPLAYIFCAMIEGNLATRALVNPESDRNHIDFSSLVLSLGCGGLCWLFQSWRPLKYSAIESNRCSGWVHFLGDLSS
jgi:hypothetical protein